MGQVDKSRYPGQQVGDGGGGVWITHVSRNEYYDR